MDVLWPDAFTPFGLLHVAVVLVSIAGWWLAVRWARRVPQALGPSNGQGAPGERLWRRAAALFVWGTNAAWSVRQALPEQFSWGHSLPLHLCDFAWMAAGGSLWSGGDPQRLRHQVPVLWGFALSILGYVTPAVTAGPPSIYFWSFWLCHWQILAVALVNVFAFGVRPDARGLRGTLLLTAAVVALATGVNLLLDTSYCFTGRHVPDNPTPLDLLGDWPLRVLWILLLGGLALTLVALPFLPRCRPRAPGDDPRSGA